MKTAIYIEDGVVQLVITPESEFEKNVLTSFEKEPLQCKIFSGSFYDCRGGWVRQNEFREPHGFSAYNTDNNDKSIIIRIDPETKPA